ncbi:MAG TPA: hypothetical protein VMM92_02210 [Thermoanaerobaculia bacterium]|nr:hypothetical protein [Thermoanaerobaculia bacterium]
MSVDYSQPPQPPKKGLGPLGWIAIGCGILFIICAAVLAVGGYFAKRGFDKFQKNPTKTAAEFIVRANPDLELVSTDDTAGTMTVKNKKTNETVTMNFADIKNGKFKFTTDKGTATIDASGANGTGTLKVTDEKGQTSTMSAGAGSPKNLPSWLPSYPGGTTQGSYTADTPQGHTGTFSLTTSDSVEKVASYYESQFKAGGLSVEKNLVSSNDKTSGGTVVATSADKKHVASLMLSSQGSGTQAAVTYEEKN